MKSHLNERYEAPQVVVLGTFGQVTLSDKRRGLSDGVWLLTIGPLANHSA